MKLKNKVRFKIYNHLFFRIYQYFAIILSLFAVLIGLIFMRLYEHSSVDSYRYDIQKEAERIASKVALFVMKNKQKDFTAYLDAIKSMGDAETKDIWVVSNKNARHPMNDGFTNANVEDVDLSKEIDEVLNRAFEGKSFYNKGFDKVYEMVVLRVATPVYDAGGNVIGAVMIVSLVQSQKRIIESSKSLIITSIVAGLIISFVIAILFARQIAKPISTMRRIAMELMKGNYEVKTKICQKDEIGDLAKTLDILSERLQENERTRADLEQMRLDFFSNVSHELRTPITVMQGYTELFVDGVVTEEEKKQQYYGRMLLECKSMERLVGDLLTLSKMQNPDFHIEVEPVNLVQIFDDLVRSAHVIAEKKNVMLCVEKAVDCCMMLGDYDRLRQMFLVIIDNAIKFSNENGKIFIKIKNEDKLRIWIQDEGIGISEEELPYIFEKFYKSKLRQNAKGSGLGLMIAKQIAIRHGGEIKVQSTVGIGTTFEFYFDKMDIKMV